MNSRRRRKSDYGVRNHTTNVKLTRTKHLALSHIRRLVKFIIAIWNSERFVHVALF